MERWNRAEVVEDGAKQRYVVTAAEIVLAPGIHRFDVEVYRVAPPTITAGMMVRCYQKTHSTFDHGYDGFYAARTKACDGVLPERIG